MRSPLWKYLLILAVVVVSLVYSLPNLYPDERAIQISGASASIPADQAVLESATRALNAAGIPFHGAEAQEGGKGVLLRVNTATEQLRAQDEVRRALGDNYVVALNLAPTTPGWLKALHAAPMKLGLDLRGGVHFLLEVDMTKALEQRQESYVNDIKGRLRDQKLAYRSVAEHGQGFALKFENAADRQSAEGLLRSDFKEFAYADRDDADGFYLDLTFTQDKLRELSDYAVNQNLTTIRNRVNELGVAESVVQRQGSNRIVVELPGVQDTAEAKRVLGRTATLEFRAVDDVQDSSVTSLGREVFPFKNNPNQLLYLKKEKIIGGDQVSDASMTYDESMRPVVSVTLDARGGHKMADFTRANLGKNMAVLFVETKRKQRTMTDASGQPQTVYDTITDKSVISNATIQGLFSSKFQISGLGSPDEAKELALLLRAGALAAPMYFVEERTIGPTMGEENIRKGLTSTLVGFVLVAIFMVVFYRLFGLVADIALFINVMVVVAAMASIGAALSLPGIAGVVLTVGMAVDANVLICERIREELHRGLSPVAAIIAGYDRAFTTIIDSHVTTLIVAVILFAVGAGPVKGFAATLFIGILSSLFTSITVTRSLVNLIYGGGRRVTKLSI